MALKASRVAVGTAPTRIDVVPDSGSNQSVAVKNLGTASVFLGGSAVTVDSGWELAASDAVSFDLGSGDKLYGIAASGSVNLSVMQVGV